MGFIKEEGGFDICVIKVPNMDIAQHTLEHMVFASGYTSRHVLALGDHIEKKVNEIESKRTQLAGRGDNEWTVVDTGRIAVHLFTRDARGRYQLEKLWTLDNYDDQLATMRKKQEAYR
eukprot:Colp12_sorted_trinity150504_noHs@35465